MTMLSRVLALAALALLLALPRPAAADTGPSCDQVANAACANGADDTINVDWTIASGKVVDFTVGVLRLPNSTTPPSTCIVGDVYFDTNAAAGARVLLCTATDTFTAIDENGAAGAHALLSATHSDTVASTMTRGDLIVGTAGGWDDLAIGAANTVLHSDGTDATWAALSASDIGAGDLANVLVWNESCTASPCTLANAPRTADAALVVRNTLVYRRVASAPGVNEYTLSGTTLTFGGTAPGAAPNNALVTYER